MQQLVKTKQIFIEGNKYEQFVDSKYSQAHSHAQYNI